jgi:hypothetical protein
MELPVREHRDLIVAGAVFFLLLLVTGVVKIPAVNRFLAAPVLAPVVPSRCCPCPRPCPCKPDCNCPCPPIKNPCPNGK